MTHATRHATKDFYQAWIDPFLERYSMGVKEFARGIGEDPKNVAKWANAIIDMDAKDRKNVMEYINNYIHQPKIAPPAPEGLLKQMEELKGLEKRQNAVANLPNWAIRSLLAQHAKAENLTHAELAEFIEIETNEKIGQVTISNIIAGRTKNPYEKTVKALRLYIAKQNILGKFGMPVKEVVISPETKMDEIDKSKLEGMNIRVEEQRSPANTVLDAVQKGKHYVSVNLDDNDFIDVLASIGSNAALPQDRRRELIRLLFKQDFPAI